MRPVRVIFPGGAAVVFELRHVVAACALAASAQTLHAYVDVLHGAVRAGSPGRDPAAALTAAPTVGPTPTTTASPLTRPARAR